MKRRSGYGFARSVWIGPGLYQRLHNRRIASLRRRVKRGFADTVAGIRVRSGLYQRIDDQEVSPERRRIEQLPRRIRRPRLAFASRQPGDNDRQGECRYAGPVYFCDNSFNASIT